MNIGIDLDDVLLQFLPSLIKFHNATYNTNLKLQEFESYQFWDTWGGTKEQAIQKVHDFHKTSYFTSMQPVIGAQSAIKKLSKKHNLYIITSRQTDVTRATIDSVEKHFPKSFSEVHFTNHYAQNGGSSKTKKEVCDELQIDAMIEDSADYALNCLDTGRKVFLMDQPWNRKIAIPSEIYRVNSWNEIIDSI